MSCRSAKGETRGPAPPVSSDSASMRESRSSCQRLAAEERGEQKTVRLQREAQLDQRAGQIVDPVQRERRDDQVERAVPRTADASGSSTTLRHDSVSRIVADARGKCGPGADLFARTARRRRAPARARTAAGSLRADRPSPPPRAGAETPRRGSLARARRLRWRTSRGSNGPEAGSPWAHPIARRGRSGNAA